MANSVRNTILSAVKTALTSPAMSSVAAANVFRSRPSAYAKNEFPCAVILPFKDSPTRPNQAKTHWDFTFMVQVGIRAAIDEIPDAVADEILVEVHNRIMAASSLESLTVSREPGPVDWLIDEADQALCWVSMQFRVSYRTSYADISSA